jgi:hypothetical protein
MTVIYIIIMTVNPYVSHIIEQTGMSEREVVTSMMPSLRPMTFPCEIHGRHFETHDEYLNELHEYLNGMWPFPANAGFIYLYYLHI